MPYYEQELDQLDSSSHLLTSHFDARYRLPPHNPTPTHEPEVVTGFDWDLGRLLLNGLITFCWGIALIIFQTGIVPISWNLSQYGQRHRGITNVIITGVATVSTSHLKFTVHNTLREISAHRLRQGFTLRRWAWIQEFARWTIRPPFTWWRHPRHPVAWPMWLLVYGLMASHSASLVAILQPRKSRCEFTRTFCTKLSPCRITLGACYVQRSNTLRCQCEIVDTESEPDSGVASGQSGGTDRIATWELLRCVPDTWAPMEPTYN